MNNHWQLKTTPVLEKKDDKLSHDSIAELLREKIDYLFSQDNIPSCICLNGEYGSGKSSIVNLLFKKWEGATNKKVVHFNIWRHKDENTYYALFRNIYYALKNKANKDFRKKDFLENLTESGEILNLDCDFSKLVYASFSKKEIDKRDILRKIKDFTNDLPKYVCQLSWGIVKLLFVLSLVFSIVVFVIEIVSSQELEGSFHTASKFFLFFLTSSVVISSLFRNIFKNIPTLFKLHIQTAETTVSLPSISNTEQLQSIFRNMLHKYCNNGEGKKLIVIIEDVDRKHNDEIIKTLNELRTFIDLGRAIFIIPCDLKNIERAFVESGIDKSKDLDDRYIKWKAKDFYSKIFSHVVTIPTQCQQDLRCFLVNKINEESLKHPINKYFINSQTLDDLVDILLVNSIKTPREAVNIFNRFTLQFEHALKLEKGSDRLNEGTVSNRVLEYARIYILSTYYGLEKELLRYPELAAWILKIFRSNDNQNRFISSDFSSFTDLIPGYAVDDVIKMYDDGVISSEIEEFVSRTELYSSDLVKSFIYLDETSYCGLVGNKIYNEVLSCLKTKNINKLKSLLAGDLNEISEVVERVTRNISYRTDYQTILPSLIDVFDLLDKTKKSSIANFVLEHFNRISHKDLYEFTPKSVTDVFRFGDERSAGGAKCEYFSVLGDGREAITEYCNEEKAFDISVALIIALDMDLNYVPSENRDELKEYLAIPFDDEIEFSKRKKYLELILELDEKTIREVFDYRLLNRCVSDVENFYYNYPDNKEIKKGFDILIKNLIIEDRSAVIEYMDVFSQSDNLELKTWYLDFIKKNEKYFKEDVYAEKAANAIVSNILLKHLTPDKYSGSEELIDVAITQFAQIDGTIFKAKGSRTRIGFDNIVSHYKELILNNNSSSFLEYVLKCIDKHEEVANYFFYNYLSDSVMEYVTLNLCNASIDSDDHLRCIVLADFMVQKNWEIKWSELQKEQLRDFLMAELDLKISQNGVNSDSVKAIYCFVKKLSCSPSFKKVLAHWLEEKNVSIRNNVNSLQLYEGYLEIVDLVKEELGRDYLNQLLSRCDYWVSSNRGNYERALLGWKWIFEIAVLDVKLSGFADKIIPEIFNNYKNRERSFDKKIKYYVCLVLTLAEVYKDETRREQYFEFLLWAANDDIDLMENIGTDIEYASLDQQYRVLQLISTQNKWDIINTEELFSEKVAIKLSKYMIIECKDFSLFEKFYEHTVELYSWSNIITQSFLSVCTRNLIDLAKGVNELDTKLISKFDKSKANGEVDMYIIELLNEDFDKKITALSLIDKLKLDVNVDVLNEITTKFVNVVDINTDFVVLQMLKEWIKKHKKVRSTGINARLKEILKIADGELELKIKRLVKY